MLSSSFPFPMPRSRTSTPSLSTSIFSAPNLSQNVPNPILPQQSPSPLLPSKIVLHGSSSSFLFPSDSTAPKPYFVPIPESYRISQLMASPSILTIGSCYIREGNRELEAVTNSKK